MRIRLKLSVRMLLLIVSVTSVVFYVTLRIFSNRLKKDTYAETMRLNENQAKKYASILQSSINIEFHKVVLLKQIFSEKSELSYGDKRSIYNFGLKNLVETSPKFTASWDSWELRFTDNNWVLPYGRVSRSYYRGEDNNILFKIDSVDLEGDNYESIYYKFKIAPEMTISNPYKGSYSGFGQKVALQSSIIVPLEMDNQFSGLLGVNFSLESFQQYIDSINSKNTYGIIFFSSNGDIITHPDRSLVGVNISEVDTTLTRQFNIIDKIQSDGVYNFTINGVAGNDSSYLTLVSFKVGETHTPWAILISAPLQEINQQFNKTFGVLKKSAIIGLIVIIIVVLIFILSIVNPIVKTRGILNRLAVGDVHGIDELTIKTRDELGEMANSVNTVSKGLNHVTEFAENIGDGNYDYEFNKLSDSDTLGLSIIEMRNSLKRVMAEEIVRKEEALQLEWASAGMNIFNKVLRVDNKNLENLTYEIIKVLTTYLNSHMGGIYLKTDTNEDEFELISFIGFSKEKYKKNYIRSGEGITGQCIVERQTIFINDVPSDFDKVGSGLGLSIPKSILVVPLISNQVLVGVLEVESLNNIEQYHIDFVERIAETIAATVSTVKNNVRTATLLDKAQKQAEELEQQEEEMRQNMEEMQATQEEASKQELELSCFIEGFNNLLPIIEYDTNGRVIDINDNYLKKYKSKKSQVLGKYHKADLFMNESDKAKHNEFWSNLENGEEQESLEYIKSGRDDFWHLEKFVPVKDQYGLVQKVLCLGFDITEQRKTESKIKQIQDGINKKQGKKKKSKVAVQVVDLNQKYEVIDLTYLKMVYKKDAGKIYNILKLYYDTLPSQIKEIEELITARDFKKLKSKISSLKTKMSYLGLKKVYARLGEMEKLLAAQKNLADIPNMIKEVLEFWSIAYRELQQILVISGFNK